MENEKNTIFLKRNNVLSFWKGMACFGVVLFHCKISNYIVDGVIQAMFRFACPLFFMISGYFCWNSDLDVTRKKMPHKIKHIGALCLYSSIFYLVYLIALLFLGNANRGAETRIQELAQCFSIENIYIWLVWNQDPVIKILWFLFALLYAYLLFGLVIKKGKIKGAYIVALILGIGHFFIGNVLFLLGIDVPIYLYRNWLFYAFPFFMAGYFVSEFKDKYSEKISSTVGHCLIALGMIMSALEWFWVSRQDTYVGSILICIGIFAVALHNPELNSISAVTAIGDRYSLIIYIVHPCVLVVLNRIMESINSELAHTIYGYTVSGIVFIASLMVAIIFEKIKKILKRDSNE